MDRDTDRVTDLTWSRQAIRLRHAVSLEHVCGMSERRPEAATPTASGPHPVRVEAGCGTRHSVPLPGSGAPLPAHETLSPAGDDDLYALEREEPNARRGGGWMVRLRRRGRVIARLFKDSVHGSPQAALAQARAYREAVIAEIPPRTNREQAARLRRSNTSGLSGVARLELTGGAVWRATLTAKAGLKRRSFAVAEYGEAGAERRAIAQRRAWLDALPAAFTLSSPHAEAVAQCRFRAELERAVEVHPNESLSPAELESRLAAIDARFDALRPQRLRVRVKRYASDRLSVAVSDAGRPARRRLVQVRSGDRPAPEVLREAAAAIGLIVSELYGAPVARWFHRAHLHDRLAPGRFEGDAGFNICVLVPSLGARG